MIDASGLWDSQPAIDALGLIDTVVGSSGWGLIDSLGGIVPIGTYSFAGALDLGVVEKSRLTATVDTVSFDTGDMIDFRTDRIDGWLSIDGDLINDTGVTLYVRTTSDDPGGAPDWSAWQRFSMGDYEAQAFQWKVELQSASPTHNVLVTGLSVTVDMPDRREYARATWWRPWGHMRWSSRSRSASCRPSVSRRRTWPRVTSSRSRPRARPALR